LSIVCRGGVSGSALLFLSGIGGFIFGNGVCLSNLALKFIFMQYWGI